MSRVINTDSTGKQRNQHMRLAAELIRRLSQKTTLDDDVKDMCARLVFCFRDIDEGIESSATVWDNRDYYMKAEELRKRWRWAGHAALDMEALVLNENWHELPALLARLLPRFDDINVTKYMKKESEWQGAYQRLMLERAPGR
jgi:hypothetical protein